MTPPDRPEASGDGRGRSWWRSPWAAIVALVLGALAGILLNDGVWEQGLGLPSPLPDGLVNGAIGLFDLVGDIFIRLLKLLVAPLVLFSIVSGVASIGDPRRLGKLGGLTFLYYICTSLLAVVTGLVLVNLMQPGVDAALRFEKQPDDLPAAVGGLREIILGIVPDNIFRALADLDMLPIITFALLLGVVLTRMRSDGARLLVRGFNAGFELFTQLALLILAVLPVAVFALVARVAAEAEVGLIGDLAWYALTVVMALGFHALVTLPLIARLLARVNPRRWASVMQPALVTAFSTSSSSATLPVTIETAEKRGGVPNRVASFVLPLGATINMDGTALYECVGTIFLAQYYASTQGYDLSLTRQGIVVLTALLASIGAAGIPSAGLVMMTIILTALELPLEGALLLLAIDRPLDMMRTAVNVWSDSVGTAVLARTEGARLL